MSNNKIPTAEEFVEDELKDLQGFKSAGVLDSLGFYDVVEMLNKYAKLHVEAALKAAAKDAKINIERWSHAELPSLSFNVIDKNSILNAYPLTNIK